MLETLAQKKQITIQWEIAGTLPPVSGHNQALGLAGAIAGVYNEVLIVAGGSNFPGGIL